MAADNRFLLMKLLSLTPIFLPQNARYRCEQFGLGASCCWNFYVLESGSVSVCGAVFISVCVSFTEGDES